MTMDENVQAGEDISEGQGLLFKELIRDGVGEETPCSGCRVRVHYTGTLLDGTVFDSSRDRNEPFEFTLGRGQVIKAWDNGVKTMRKDELCVLTCAPEYGYGATGSPPKIPPNSWLKFEVEMIDWEGEDLSPKKNKGIIRYTIEAGSGYDRPTDGTFVEIEMVGKLHGIEDAQPFETRSVSFHIGEGSEFGVCPGVEKALEKFSMGEKSRLIIQPKYAFKAGSEKLGVPSEAVVEYTVTLKNFEKVNTDSDDYEAVMKHGKLFKEKGTNYFKASKYPLAVKMYKTAVTTLNKCGSLEGGDNPTECNNLLLSVHLNLALCYLKITPIQAFDAKDSAVNALNIDSKNVKGLFRKGQALQALGEYNEAIETYQQLLEIEPENKAAANQIIMCKSALKQQSDKEKKLYANMFEKFAQKDREMEKLSEKSRPDVMCEGLGEWGVGPPTEWADTDRDRAPTDFEKENPNILMLDKEGTFVNM